MTGHRGTASNTPDLTAGQQLRRVANLVNGSTLLGLGLARWAGTKIVSGPEGLLLAAGWSLKLPVAGAFTVGNVVVFRSQTGRPLPDPRNATPALLFHEGRHATQYALCLGLPFLPLYFAAAGWSLLRTGDPASANFFEVSAGLEAGAYRQAPTRPFSLRRRRTVARTNPLQESEA